MTAEPSPAVALGQAALNAARCFIRQGTKDSMAIDWSLGVLWRFGVQLPNQKNGFWGSGLLMREAKAADPQTAHLGQAAGPRANDNSEVNQ